MHSGRERAWRFAYRWSLRLVAVAIATLLTLWVADLALSRFGPRWLRSDSRSLQERLDESARQDPDPSKEVSLKGLIRASSNPRLIYELKPGLQVRFESAPVTINQDGFRGRDVPREKPADVLRIVAVGDSTLFGWGIADHETFAERLDSALNAGRVRPRVEVLNFGVPGYNTMQEAEQLESVGLLYRPDVVVISFIPNDDQLAYFLIQNGRGHGPFELGRVRDLLNAAVAALEVDPAGPQADLARVPPELASLVGDEAVHEGLRRMAYLARRHDFKLVLFPLGGPQPLTLKVAAWCQELGISYLDLDRYLAERNLHYGPENWLSPRDAHPNAAFQQVIADFLASSLPLN